MVNQSKMSSIASRLRYRNRNYVNYAIESQRTYDDIVDARNGVFLSGDMQLGGAIASYPVAMFGVMNNSTKVGR